VFGMSLTEQFLAEVEAFIAKSELNPTDFGKLAINDPNFVFDLREGRSPSARTIDKVREWMRQFKAPLSANSPPNRRRSSPARSAAE
jgi:hypothetical protein